MPLAICRIKKLKSWGEIDGSAAHTLRSRTTPNANPTVENVTLIDPLSPDIKTPIKEKIGEQKVRKNAVLAVEMLLSASPEYFRPNNPGQAGVQDQERLQEFANSVTRWLQKRYLDNVIAAQLHLDEATPHVHAYIVPLDERGKLNCYALFGSRYKLAQLQDDFAAALEPLGIVRGTIGSEATHTKIKTYYADVNRDSLNLQLERALPIPRAAEPIEDYRYRVVTALQPQLDIVNHQLSDRQRLLREKRELKKNARLVYFQQEKQQKQLEQIQALKAELAALKAGSNDLPLDEVALELGLNPDSPHSSHNSIDLVIATKQCALPEAVAWIHAHFGEQGTYGALAAFSREKAQSLMLSQPEPSFTPPSPDRTNWEQVEQYLTKKNYLPENLIQALHQQGIIFADGSKNAVFLTRDLKEKITGALSCATSGTQKGKFDYVPDSFRRHGWFYIRRGQGKNTDIQQTVLTNSPIDALSISVLQLPQTRTLYLATDNIRCLPVEFLQHCPTVIAAFNNDAVGASMNREIQSLIPQTKIKKPQLLSWNEELILQSKSTQALNREQTGGRGEKEQADPPKEHPAPFQSAQKIPPSSKNRKKELER